MNDLNLLANGKRRTTSELTFGCGYSLVYLKANYLVIYGKHKTVETLQRRLKQNINLITLDDLRLSHHMVNMTIYWIMGCFRF